MHSMVTKENFETYWSLFKTKYSKYPSYIEYFQKTYIDSEFSKWHFFDVPPNTLLTNNISESLNAMIKRDWTNRERKPLHIFFNVLKEGLIELSKEIKPWKQEVEVRTDIKLQAMKLEGKKLFVKGSHQGFYFLDKEEKTKVDSSKIERFLQNKYLTLDEFKSDFESMIVLKWDQQSKTAVCFCNYGYKYGICSHKYALELHLGIATRLLMLVPAKKRGRKKKSAPALEPQGEEVGLGPVTKKVKKYVRRK